MTQPLVSLVINNYNYECFLGGAIASALAQTYPHVEVVVVDDGSTDASRTVMAHYGDRIVPVYKANGGQASAFNAGFAASRGDIICFLDADDVVLPHKVETIVQQLPQTDSPRWCFHRLQLVPTEQTPTEQTQQRLTEPALNVNQRYELDLRQAMVHTRLKGQFPFAIPATSGLCFTRSLLAQILPMPEASAILLNDSFLQFAALGLAPGVAIATPLALQRVHSSNAYTHNAQQRQLKAPINILTAWALRDRFPLLRAFANCLFAEGLGLFWKMGENTASLKPWIDTYQATLFAHEYPSIWMRATYHYLKP